MKLFEHEIEEEIEHELKINNGQDSRKHGLWSDVAFSIIHCQQQQSYSGLYMFTRTIKLNLLLNIHCFDVMLIFSKIMRTLHTLSLIHI